MSVTMSVGLCFETLHSATPRFFVLCRMRRIAKNMSVAGDEYAGCAAGDFTAMMITSTDRLQLNQPSPKKESIWPSSTRIIIGGTMNLRQK